MAAVILTSGERVQRETWEDVEKELQFRQFEAYPTTEAWREDACNRALHQTGEELDSFGSSLEFMWELSRAQWLEVSIGAEGNGHGRSK